MIMYECLYNVYAWLVCVRVFFFKQKTAYEMRISDWSSDVCSSDLRFHLRGDRLPRPVILDQHPALSIEEVGQLHRRLRIEPPVEHADQHLGHVHDDPLAAR